MLFRDKAVINTTSTIQFYTSHFGNAQDGFRCCGVNQVLARKVEKSQHHPDLRMMLETPSSGMESIATNYPFFSSGYSKVARNLVCVICSSAEWFSEKSATMCATMRVKQRMEKHSGIRLTQFCLISVSDGKEDIYSCENATDFYLRFGALPWNHNDKCIQTALLKPFFPIFPHS